MAALIFLLSSVSLCVSQSLRPGRTIKSFSLTFCRQQTITFHIGIPLLIMITSAWLKSSSQKKKIQQMWYALLCLAMCLYHLTALSKETCLPQLKACLSLSAESAGMLLPVIRKIPILNFELDFGFIHSLTLLIHVLAEDCDFTNVLLWSLSMSTFPICLSSLNKCVFSLLPSL